MLGFMYVGLIRYLYIHLINVFVCLCQITPRQVTIFLHYLWVGPLQAAAVVGLLWAEIGPSCLAGMGVLLFLMPVQSMFGRLFSKFR